MTLEELKARREQILAVARRHGAYDLRVFGSVARGEADRGSDVDFLVALEPGRSLLDLRDVLGCEVDVVTEAGLRPRVWERVVREAAPL